jgi:hypothetical protein
MAKKITTMKQFEKSAADKDPPKGSKGYLKEGSKAEMARDRRQFAAYKRGKK